MTTSLLLVAALTLGPTDTLGPGDHLRSLTLAKQRRTYLVHVPPTYNPSRPMPLVVALHGMAMNARMMEGFTGLSEKADAAGFIVVYPNGTGLGGVLLGWNANAFYGDDKKDRPDDVAFLTQMLDDLEATLNVDHKRIYVTGMSNGGMMAYRLAAVLSERIAAIAPVAGTMAADDVQPKRPVPVMHFHGNADSVVPYNGMSAELSRMFRFRSVQETMKTWARINGCETTPTDMEMPAPADRLKVIRHQYKSGNDTPVVLYEITGGGHTWPGMQTAARWCGESTNNISANDLMWQFFEQHPLK